MFDGRKAFKQGQQLAELGEFEEARSAFARAIEHGQGAPARAHLGLVLSNLGLAEEAVREIEAARTEEPGNVAYQLFEALIRIDAGNLNECAALLQAVLKTAPENLLAQNLAALALWKEEKYASCLERLERTGLCGNLEARVRLMLELQKKLPDLEPVAQEETPAGDAPRPGFCRPIDKFRAKLRQDRALRLLEKERPVQALAQLDAARQLDPARSSLYFFRGAALFHLNRLEEAIKEFEQVPEKDENSKPSRFYLAISRLRSGEYEAAAGALNELKDAPELFDYVEYILFFLGVCALRRGNAPEARLFFRKALLRWDPLLDEQLRHALLLHRRNGWPDPEDPPEPEEDAAEEKDGEQQVELSEPGASEEEAAEPESTQDETVARTPLETGSGAEEPLEEELPESAAPIVEGEALEEEGDFLGESGTTQLRKDLAAALSEAVTAEAVEAFAPPPADGKGGAAQAPRHARGILCIEVDESQYERVFVLMNPQSQDRLRLSPKDHLVWRLIDGKRSPEDLASHEFILEANIERDHVLSLCKQFRERGFLETLEEESSLEDLALPEKQGLYRGLRNMGRGFRFRYIGPDMSHLLRPWFALGGRWLGAGKVLVPLAILGCAGLLFFARGWISGSQASSYTPFQSNEFLWAALVFAYLWNSFGSLAHAVARASVLELNFRQYRPFGPAFRFGLFGAYVNVDDSVRLSRRRRTTLLLSGAAFELFLAGLTGAASCLLENAFYRDLLGLGAVVLGARAFLQACPFFGSELFKAVAGEAPGDPAGPDRGGLLVAANWSLGRKEDLAHREGTRRILLAAWLFAWLLAIALIVFSLFRFYF